MVSRMEKYDTESAKPARSRSQKNEHLYEQLYTNKVFTEFTEVENNNVFDLSQVSSNSLNKRENFQRSRVLNTDADLKKGVASNKIDAVVQEENKLPSERTYNINDILDEAKKNRTNVDELEKKRHLKTVEYNILSDLSQEKLKDYHDKKQKLTKDEEDNLEELIHTITSNSLRKKIDDELLSDLLPTEESETVISKELLDQIEETDRNVEVDNVDTGTSEIEIDNSFYTKSMDLSEEDFDFDSEEDDIEDRSFLEDARMSTSKKIFILLFVLLVISIVCFIIYRFI